MLLSTFLLIFIIVSSTLLSREIFYIKWPGMPVFHQHNFICTCTDADSVRFYYRRFPPGIVEKGFQYVHFNNRIMAEVGSSRTTKSLFLNNARVFTNSKGAVHLLLLLFTWRHLKNQKLVCATISPTELISPCITILSAIDLDFHAASRIIAHRMFALSGHPGLAVFVEDLNIILIAVFKSLIYFRNRMACKNPFSH